MEYNPYNWWMEDGEPNSMEKEEIEIRKVKVREKSLLLGTWGGIEPDEDCVRAYGTGSPHVYHVAVDDSVRATKIGNEDCEEDHWNSSWTRNHCEHLICHFPGYKY